MLLCVKGQKFSPGVWPVLFIWDSNVAWWSKTIKTTFQEMVLVSLKSCPSKGQFNASAQRVIIDPSYALRISVKKCFPREDEIRTRMREEARADSNLENGSTDFFPTVSP
jgi:hypothetical protein